MRTSEELKQLVKKLTASPVLPIMLYYIMEEVWYIDSYIGMDTREELSIKEADYIVRNYHCELMHTTDTFMKFDLKKERNTNY